MFPEQELLALAEKRRQELNHFLTWTARWESEGKSLRLAARPDIREAGEAVKLVSDKWWAVVVYTCIETLAGAATALRYAPRPIRAELARSIFDRMPDAEVPLGPHRRKTGHDSARKALTAACQRSEAIHQIVRGLGSFDQRYRHLRGLRAPQWGHQMCFDLLVRTGHLGVEGHRYGPELAYLTEAPTSRQGFEALWGFKVTPANSRRAEELLRQWSRSWPRLAEVAGVAWPGKPYLPADLGQALGAFHLDRGRDRPPQMP